MTTQNEILSDLERISKIMPIWTAITFVTVLIGYIGFFTFCSLNNIPFHQPNIYTIVGIGILNYIFWFLIFVVNNNPFGLRTLRIIVAMASLFWLTYDPKIWTTLAIIYIFFYGDSGIWRITELFKPKAKVEAEVEVQAESEVEVDELKSETVSDPKLNEINKTKKTFLKKIIQRKWDILDLVLFLGVLYLLSDYGNDILGLFVLISICAAEFEIIQKTRILKTYHIFIVLIITPAFLANSIVNKLNFSLIGISKNRITMTTTESDIIKGLLIYQDIENLYVKGNIESDSTFIYPKSSIKHILVHEKYKIQKPKVNVKKEKTTNIE